MRWRGCIWLGSIMISSWIFIILDLRSTITVHGDGAIDMLSDCDLVGDSVTIVGACVTHNDIWISTALGLADLERVG
tara:strand:- start:398 stop:628 length:231 start_codon:yes stop_codon:yes gene_type:complete